MAGEVKSNRHPSRIPIATIISTPKVVVDRFGRLVVLLWTNLPRYLPKSEDNIDDLLLILRAKKPILRGRVSRPNLSAVQQPPASTLFDETWWTTSRNNCRRSSSKVVREPNLSDVQVLSAPSEFRQVWWTAPRIASNDIIIPSLAFFSKLPRELRDKIWKQTYPSSGRRFSLDFQIIDKESVGYPQPPAALFVCRESRHDFLDQYRVFGIGHFSIVSQRIPEGKYARSEELHKRLVFFNPSRDMVSIGGWDLAGAWSELACKEWRVSMDFRQVAYVEYVVQKHSRKDRVFTVQSNRYHPTRIEHDKACAWNLVKTLEIRNEKVEDDYSTAPAWLGNFGVCYLKGSKEDDRRAERALLKLGGLAEVQLVSKEGGMVKWLDDAKLFHAQWVWKWHKQKAVPRLRLIDESGSSEVLEPPKKANTRTLP